MQPPIVFDDVHTAQCECEKCNKELAVEYDEEKRELDDQFHRRGDYSRDNPDIAVENVKPWAPLSTEQQLVALVHVTIKLQAQNKALLEALEYFLEHYDAKLNYPSTLNFSAPAERARAAIKAAKE